MLGISLIILYFTKNPSVFRHVPIESSWGFRSAQSLALLDLTRDQSMAVKMEDVGSLNAKGTVPKPV